jgi:hypothetical protein
VAPIQDRQDGYSGNAPTGGPTLDLTRPEAELLRPLPPGSLAVEQVRPDQWCDNFDIRQNID